MEKRKIKKNVRIESLYPKHNTKTRKDLLDYDYLDKLSEEEIRWLAQFTDEFVGGAVHKDSKGRVKKGYLHNTKELAKSCYDANNHRNNDVLAVTRANKLSFDIDGPLANSDGWYITNPEYTELDIITKIDSTKEEPAIMTFLEYLNCRDRFIESRKKELDSHFLSTFKLSKEDYYILFIIHGFKLASTRKICRLAENPEELKKFIKKSEFFQTKNNGTKSRKNSKS